MADIKTKRNDASVLDFINSVDDEVKRQDSLKLLELFERCTGEKPAMWGSAIIGYGSFHYKSERSAQEGDWPITGFSPRKQNLTLYILDSVTDFSGDLAKLGKHKTSVSCLYIKRLSDVDLGVLEAMINKCVKRMRELYP